MKDKDILKQYADISKTNVSDIDLTPFDEPVVVDIEKFFKGYKVNCKIHINFRWGVKTEWIERNHMFGHKGDLNEKQLKGEFLKAIAGMHQKRVVVFLMNYGLLDTFDDDVTTLLRYNG